MASDQPTTTAACPHCGEPVTLNGAHACGPYRLPASDTQPTTVAPRPLHRCLHRRGLARTLNKQYTGGSYVSAYVQTRVPGRIGFFLARYACGEWGFRVRSVERTGFTEWRWQLVR